MQGLIKQSFIEELLAQVDIVEFIDIYVPLKKRGASHLACCPFHHEKTPSFNVNEKKQVYHCFGCSASGNVISFAMNYLQLSFPEAIETIAIKFGLQVQYDKTTSQNKNNITLYHMLEKVSNFYQKCLQTSGIEAISYLKSRGLTGEIAKKYKVGFAKDGWHNLQQNFPVNTEELLSTGMLIKNDSGKIYDRYRHRIIFPIQDRQGRIIGFGGRALSDTEKPKYLNSPETTLFQKNRELYGLYQVIQQNANKDSIIIVEGYMDVLALVQYGIWNVVATLGTATSTYHIQLLAKHTKKIIFCFDGDAAGKQAAWRALENTLPNLDGDLAAHFIFLDDGEDPDSLVRKEGKEAFLQRTSKATALNKFFLDTLIENINISDLTGKSKLILKSKPYLDKMPNTPYKQLLINELASISRIENHRILQLTANEIDEASIVKNKNQPRSPLRVALAILLQNSKVFLAYQKLAHELDYLDKIPKVLSKIMQQIIKNPEINTASLLEFWRHTPIFNTINEVVGYKHQIPENMQAKELYEIILFMMKQNKENKIRELIEKSRKVSLTELEREELQGLLKERHTAKIL
ncbi:MAG: DNA primase [Legionellales bacterium RIFCSPHIGHO2_12_FULL_42_9]|nr:MAG: DNA primase [Legionellales bacterium RIFCSPHIGHO2_12_FULL_42_9]